MLKNNILIIDDEEEICMVVHKALKTKGIESDYSLHPEDAFQKLEKNEYDVILLDYKLPDLDGFAFVDRIINKEYLKNTRVILMTGYGDVDMGLEAIRRGCFDYITKPFNLEDLVFRIRRAMEHIRLNETINMLSKSIFFKFFDIVGQSEEMKKVINLVNKISQQDTSVLIEGDTGTGKELIAEAIHKQSLRKENVFIPVNCGALTPTLLESELFGYDKGAFTGATGTKYGILESADKGTVFLDEINNASQDLQIKLLRFLEKGEFRRVGGNKLLYSDVRVIAATNQNLDELVREKIFREDFFHRLNIVRIKVPALRERKDDIPLLVDYFLEMFNKKFGKNTSMTREVLDMFLKYYWPGNIRQLKNLIQSMVLLNETGRISPEEVPEVLKSGPAHRERILPFKDEKNEIVEQFERKYINDLLKMTKGNVSRAAELAKLDRKNLSDKISFYNIDASGFKE